MAAPGQLLNPFQTLHLEQHVCNVYKLLLSVPETFAVRDPSCIAFFVHTIVFEVGMHTGWTGGTMATCAESTIETSPHRLEMPL